MNIGACVRKLYPDIRNNEFIVHDDSDGKGAYIKKWTYAQPQPTQVELEAVYPAVLKEQKIKEFKQKAEKELMISDYKIVRQMEQNTLSAADYDALRLSRQVIREKCNTLEAQVNDINKTVAEIEAVVW